MAGLTCRRAAATSFLPDMDMHAQHTPFWKQALLVLLACVVFYVGGFATVQWWRQRRGPWEVTFRVDKQGIPGIAINQPRLGIRDVTIAFLRTHHALLADPATVRFDEPSKGDTIPFGRVKFLDTTFLPGTVTHDQFGHEIELLPRTLFVDKQERPWRSGEHFAIEPTATSAPPP